MLTREFGRLDAQGVDRWQQRVQRTADQQLNSFESYARQSIFAIPAGLQLDAPGAAPAADEAERLDAETAALEERVQKALSTKRELKRKLAAAQNVSALWAAHRTGVQQLASSQQAEGAVSALEGTQRLNGTLKQGWQLLKSADAAADDTSAAPSTEAPGPRGLQQRFTQRRAEISTVSVPDLSLLSSLLCAS